jgi:hypothetical protein
MNHCWMSPIIRSANSVEKMQVFWPWSSLRMSAWTVPRTFCRAYGVTSLSRDTSQHRGRRLPRPGSGREGALEIASLVDGGVEEDRRGWSAPGR